MKTYRVLKACRLGNGPSAKEGETVELTERQARYLVLSGHLEEATAAASKKRSR